MKDDVCVFIKINMAIRQKNRKQLVQLIKSKSPTQKETETKSCISKNKSKVYYKITDYQQ